LKTRVVLLDDDKSVRLSLKGILEHWGFEVIASASPVFCPVFLGEEHQCPVAYMCADTLLTDINMPDMTGLQFLENQRQKGCKVKYIAVMSGNWKDEEIAHASRLSCSMFKKPIDIEKLREWLNECEKGINPKRKLSDLPLNK